MRKILCVFMLGLLVSMTNHFQSDSQLNSKEEVAQFSIVEEFKSGLYKCIKIDDDENPEGDFAMKF